MQKKKLNISFFLKKHHCENYAKARYENYLNTVYQSPDITLYLIGIYRLCR